MRNLTGNLNNSLMLRFFNSMALFFLCYGTPLFAMSESVGCNDTFVTLSGEELVIDVTPTGSDDTVNMQCALDAAVADGIPVVRLSAGTFFISSLSVEGFKGTLEGKTKISSIISVLDNSVDCVAMADSGRTPSVIKFIKGEPRIRFLTLTADHPCMGASRISNFLHFTGGSANAADCTNDVIFAAVDRIILEGTDATSGPFVGISVWPEGDQFGGCKVTLLGTFKLNRSEISNTLFGLMTTMKSGAQVDVNFNEFHDNQIAVYLLNTNQNTTVTANKFFSTATFSALYNGVSIATLSASAPTSTRVVVHNNEFNVSTSNGGTSVSIVGVQDPVRTNVSSVITNNTFNLVGTKPWGVFFGDISNTHVSANRFNGSGFGAVFVSGSTPVSGWTITANTGLASFESAIGDDISLGETTSRCIVGPGQGATVGDQGTNNSKLTAGKALPTVLKSATGLDSVQGSDEDLIRMDVYRKIRDATDMLYTHF